MCDKTYTYSVKGFEVEGLYMCVLGGWGVDGWTQDYYRVLRIIACTERLRRILKGVPFVNRRCTKRVPFS